MIEMVAPGLVSVHPEIQIIPLPLDGGGPGWG